MVVHTHGDAHAAVDLDRIGLLGEPAADLVQVLSDRHFVQVGEAGVQCPPVVPRDAGGLLNQLPEQPAPLFRVDGIGSDARPVAQWPAGAVRRPMRTDLARRRPHHEDMPAAHHLGRKQGLILRIEAVAVAAQPLLRRLQLGGGETFRRQTGSSVALGDSNDDVAAVQVVVVVGERADRLEHLRPGGVWIPGGLELYPHRLHAAAVEQVGQVDRESVAHGVHGIGSRSAGPPVRQARGTVLGIRSPVQNRS